MHRWIIAFCALTLLLPGCTRLDAETKIESDGAFSRSVTFEVTVEPSGSEEATDLKKKFAEVIQEPQGEGWSKAWTEKTEEGAIILTAKKNFKPGEVSEGDISHLSQGKKVATNRVAIESLGDGVFEYKESFRYLLDRNPTIDFDEIGTDIQAQLDELKVTVTPEQVKTFSQKMGVQIVRQVFGPSDPILSLMLTQPNFATQKLKMAMNNTAFELAGEVFGDAMTNDLRRRFVSALLSGDSFENPAGVPKNPSEATPESQSMLVSHTIVVKVPGEIIEANGLIDKLERTVVWSFYLPSVEVEDFDLKVKYKVD